LSLLRSKSIGQRSTADDALVKYQWGTFLSSTGKITDEDAVGLAGYWDDPAAVVARAQGEPARRDEYDKFDSQLRKARLEAAQKSMYPDNDDGAPFTTDYVTSRWPAQKASKIPTV
jgi:hypothetical protein